MRTLLLGLTFASLAICALHTRALSAELQVESVVVNGRRIPDQEIKEFVASRAAPTFKLGKVARWETGICPTVMGLDSAFTKFVITRVKDIALKVGAPINARASCQPNIQIVFTNTPQALLDDIRKKYDVLLGYHDNESQADKMAKVTHPVQGWYSTSTVDVRGARHFDGGKIPGIGCIDPPKCLINMARAGAYAVSGTRLTNGLHSSFHDVIIVVDPQRLAGFGRDELSDYISFLALGQPRLLDDCEQLPTILNLFASGCTSSDISNQLSEADIGYLRGLYHMTSDAAPNIQKDEITYQVKQTMLGH